MIAIAALVVPLGQQSIRIGTETGEKGGAVEVAAAVEANVIEGSCARRTEVDGRASIGTAQLAEAVGASGVRNEIERIGGSIGAASEAGHKGRRYPEHGTMAQELSSC